ncbi:MAG: hypothetical protein RR359_04290 [Bacilli bacterium]
MERNNSGQMLLSILGVAILVVAVVGVSFAFFTYTGEGKTDNTITTGTLVFAYSDADAAGNGVTISNAIPMTDLAGKDLTGAGNVFAFNVTATATGANIAYEVIAKKVDSAPNELPGDAVRILLKHGTTNAAVTTEAPLTLDATKVRDYTSLGADSKGTGKLLFSDTITAGTASYAKYFELRMWLGEVAMGPAYNGKTFKIRINVEAKNA